MLDYSTGSSALRKGTVYTMVDERGASVYSVTPLAEEELPDMGTNQRSAVSIGEYCSYIYIRFYTYIILYIIFTFRNGSVEVGL